MNKSQFDQHAKILGWLFIIMHALGLVIGGFVFLLLAGIGVVSGEPEALGVLGLVGLFVALVTAVLSIPGLLAGYGLLKRTSWGRILAIIIGILNLPSFPFGTALGVYALYIMFQDGAEAYFSGVREPEV
ncbi:MAG: hypothetical protein GX552_12065 [Chloroflexi bacterium]|jgi:hypothetical protein|nr:hypothetical protein [Chloroflexota bacterium]